MKLSKMIHLKTSFNLSHLSFHSSNKEQPNPLNSHLPRSSPLSLSQSTMDPHFPSLLLALLISLRGLRSSSLSPSGALAAFLFGYLSLALPLRLFGVTLLGFYFAGSKVTKLKHSIKATYEELDKSQQGGGGKRNWIQVVCNAGVSVVCAVAWRWWFSGEFTAERGWQDEGKWCVVAVNGGEYGVRKSSSRVLVLIAIAFSSACCGDTVRFLPRSLSLCSSSGLTQPTRFSSVRF